MEMTKTDTASGVWPELGICPSCCLPRQEVQLSLFTGAHSILANQGTVIPSYSRGWALTLRYMVMEKCWEPQLFLPPALLRWIYLLFHSPRLRIYCLKVCVFGSEKFSDMFSFIVAFSFISPGTLVGTSHLIFSISQFCFHNLHFFSPCCGFMNSLFNHVVFSLILSLTVNAVVFWYFSNPSSFLLFF